MRFGPLSRLMVVAAGVGLGILAWKEWRLTAAAQETPQRITCAELGEKGPGSNAHVVLADFLLLENAFIYREKRGKWAEAWIPAVPLGGAYHRNLLELYERLGEKAVYPPPSDLRVVVRLPDARSEVHVAAIAAQDTLQGLVVNEVESLGKDERRLLSESYPGNDFDRVWILEAGRKPKSTLLVLVMGAGALGLLVLGVRWLLASLRGSGQPLAPPAP